MSAEVKISGVKEMMAKIQALRNGFRREVAAALYAEANIELLEAKKRTPVDFGTLKDSGFVTEPVFGAGEKVKTGISVRIGFGGAASAYAVYVHEDLEAFHPVGQAKFLESTLQESAPKMLERITRRIDLKKAAAL